MFANYIWTNDNHIFSFDYINMIYMVDLHLQKWGVKTGPIRRIQASLVFYYSESHPVSPIPTSNLRPYLPKFLHVSIIYLDLPP